MTNDGDTMLDEENREDLLEEVTFEPNLNKMSSEPYR